MQVVSAQIKGAVMLAAAIGQSATDDEARRNALQRASQQLQEMLEPECQAFIGSVERLVLSQLEMFSGSLLHNRASSLLLRADVLTSALNNQLKGMSLRDACSGTFARYFCKPDIALEYSPDSQTLRIDGGPLMTGVHMTRVDNDTGARVIMWKKDDGGIPSFEPLDPSQQVQIVRVRTDGTREHMDSVWARRQLDLGHYPSGALIQPGSMEYSGEYDVETLEYASFRSATTASVMSFANMDHAIRAQFPKRTAGGYARAQQGGGSALWVAQWRDTRRDEGSILCPFMGWDQSNHAYDSTCVLHWKAAPRESVSMNIDFGSLPPGPTPGDHVEQVTTALLFRAPASGERIKLRVYGIFDMGPYDPSCWFSPTEMGEAPGPRWQSGDGSLTHRVQLFLDGSDGTSVNILDELCQWAATNPAPVVAKEFDTGTAISTSVDAHYSLRVAHTSDCNGSSPGNHLFFRMFLIGVGIVRPPQEMVVY